MKTLHTEIGKGTQEVIYTEVVALESFKLRIKIKSDSFDEQCFAKIELFAQNSGRWNPIADIHPSAMKTPKKLRNKSDHADPAVYAADRLALINQAAAILDLKPCV